MHETRGPRRHLDRPQMPCVSSGQYRIGSKQAQRGSGVAGTLPKGREMATKKRESGERWQEPLKGLAFEVGDQGIFDIKDPKTRVRALRRYFFPKLNLLLNSARSLISSIYGAESLHVFTEAQRPKPKDGAEITTSFNDLHLGLVGVRVESGLDLSGSNGKPVQYGVSHLWFEVMRRGTIAVTFFPIIYGKDASFDERVSKAFQEYEDLFCSICGATFVTSAAYQSLASFSESISPQHLRECAFFSQGIDFPVGQDNGLRRLVATFAALFPFQKLVTDLSMKRPTTFERDLNAFSPWWEANGREIFVPERDGVERDQSSADHAKVDWESDLRTLVTGSQRFRIFDRDDYKCLACGRTSEHEGVILHVDHILPRSKGGTDEDSNLQTLCSECNIGKGNRSSRDLRAS